MRKTMFGDHILTQDIWAGKVEAVETARAKYQANPETEFSDWVHTLYLFRTVPRYKDELVLLAVEIQKYGKSLEDTVRNEVRVLGDYYDKLTEKGEVICSIMRWLSLQPSVCESDRMWSSALHLSWSHLGLVNLHPMNHTIPFLCTTSVMLMLDRPQSALYETPALLKIAAVLAPYTGDSYEQAEVWRRIGAIYLRRKNPIGFWYLGRSLLVQGIPAAVRRKTLFFW